MGPRAPSLYHQLNRIDNDGNYEPDNCDWAVRTKQCRNRRSNYLVTIGDRTQSLAAWVEEYGAVYRLAHQRIKKDGRDRKSIDYPSAENCLWSKPQSANIAVE